MRPNPAYKALEIAKNKSEFNAERRADLKGNNYFLATLPVNEAPLKIAGQTYHPQPRQQTHLSIYEKFDLKNPVLSAFHVTWYGFRELLDQVSNNNNPQKQMIEVHIYFDQMGRILLCRVTDQTSKEQLKMSPPEEVQLRRYGREVAAKVLENTLLFVTSEYKGKSNEVDQLFKKLEQLSVHIKTQYQKYKTTTQDCITAIQEKNAWTFGKADSREKLLKNTLFSLEIMFEENKQSKPKKGPQLYQPVIEEKPLDQKTPPDQSKEKEVSLVEKKVVVTKTQSKTNELLEQLMKIDEKIKQLTKQNKSSAVEKVMKKQELLQQKLNLISESLNIVSAEEMLEVFQSLNKSYFVIKNLFQEEAKKGNVNHVKRLAPFVDFINPNLFNQLIKKGNVQICEFFLQTFDECVFYMNHVSAGYAQSGVVSFAVGLLCSAYLGNRKFDFIKMLLENGADPNFDANDITNSTDLLTQVLLDDQLFKEDRWKFVKLLLEHGANPNPNPSKKRRYKILTLNDENNRKAKPKLAQGKGDLTRRPSKEKPLKIAIRVLEDLEIIDLLLKYGASVTESHEGFDAIGLAICDAKKAPNINIVRRLVAAGGDINAQQGKKENLEMGLPIFYACQRVPEDLSTVKSLIEMGADPNRAHDNFIIIEGETLRVPMSSFFKAATKGHQRIVKYLLEQKNCPLTLTTIAETVSLYLFAKPEITTYTVSSKDGIYLGALIESESDKVTPLLIEMTTRDYNSEERKQLIQNAKNTAKECFSNKKYLMAIPFFHIPLLFGYQDEKLAACYNIGSCYFQLNHIDRARDMFENCVSYRPDSDIGKNAQKFLNKLNTGSSTMRFA